ncbi:MAG TPA: tetratricopeptide repeat protein [Isosphaeraceae bacterium]|jgi:Tfp pilus assembly protein PilF|nr:tetratricopeptide repeat protein [Isosphaeraceae bacterium]
MRRFIAPMAAAGQGLACVLSLAATGCHSVTNKVKPETVDAAALKGDPADKTQFHSEVGASQEVGVHIDLARAFETRGNFEAAVTEYQKAVDAADGPGARKGDSRVTDKQKALAHRRMGAALDRLGRFAQAEVHYRQALKCSPNDALVWNDAGYSYYLQHRWGDAERSLLQAAKLDPANSRVQTNLGLTLAAEGKTDAALAALAKSGGPVVAQANLGYILAATGKTDQARKHYQAAIDMQPDFEAARFALTRLDAPKGSPVAPTAPALAAAPSAPREVIASGPLVLGAPVSPLPPNPAPWTAPFSAPQPIPGGTSSSTRLAASPTPPMPPLTAPTPISVPQPVMVGSPVAMSQPAPAPIPVSTTARSLPAPAATTPRAVAPKPLNATVASRTAASSPTGAPVILRAGAPGATGHPAPATPALVVPVDTQTVAATKPVASGRTLPSDSWSSSPVKPMAGLEPLAIPPPPALSPVASFDPIEVPSLSSTTKPVRAPEPIVIPSIDASRPMLESRPARLDVPVSATTAPSSLNPALVSRGTPGRAASDAGIPLPARRPAPRQTVSDFDLSRASASSGIPLPSSPASTLAAPRP